MVLWYNSQRSAQGHTLAQLAENAANLTRHVLTTLLPHFDSAYQPEHFQTAATSKVSEARKRSPSKPSPQKEKRFASLYMHLA